MTIIEPYIKGVYPTIEGNDRTYFDTEFQKIQQTLGQLREALLPCCNDLTISSGAITFPESDNPVSILTVDTEASASSDDLNAINDGSEGQIVILKAANSARTVVVKDNVSNIDLNGDFSLNNAEDTITLVKVGTNWVELSRSDNGA